MRLRSIFIGSLVAGIFCICLPGCVSLPQIRTGSSFAGLGNDLPVQTPNFAKITYEKSAKQIATWVRQNDFEVVETFFQTHQRDRTSARGGNYYLSSVIRSVFDDEFAVGEENLANHLDKWINLYPDSSLAYLFRAKFVYEIAWQIRGEQIYRKTPKDRHRKYVELMKEASSYLSSAYQLDSTHPLVLLEILEFSRSIGMPRDEFESFFSRLMTIDPYLAPAYLSKAYYLSPQWNGSQAELMQFVHEAMAKAPKGSSIPMIIIQAHDSLARNSEIGWNEYMKQPQVWADLEYAYTRLIDDFPNAGLYPAWYAELAMDSGRHNIAKKYIQIALEQEPNHPKILEIQKYINQ